MAVDCVDVVSVNADVWQVVVDYFGKDFSEVLRSVNNLSKGFGISAQEALKLVRAYPRYFKEAGLSAEEFIAISTNAAKQGIFFILSGQEYSLLLHL